MTPEDVRRAIAGVLSCTHLHVEGDGSHFFAEIVSSEFAGKNRLARHRMVKDGLKQLIGDNALHALSITLAATPEEWNARN